MKSVKQKTWRNFIEMCNKLNMPNKEVERLITKKGEHVIGKFILRVERESSLHDRKLALVSLWKDGNCCYKGTVNLFPLRSPRYRVLSI